MKITNEKFLKIYNQETEKIELLISNLFKNKKPKSLYEPCSYLLSGGGKRLRPFLVLISAKASGGNFKEVYNAAIGIELLHNFTLAHDDIMDNSDLRRGRLTLHKKYDVNTAILAGDNLIAIAYKLLLMDSKKNIKQIIETFTNGIIEVCEGQSLDKEFELKENVTINEYKTMIYKKTAALAEMSCAIGSLIVNSNKKNIKAVSDFGKYLGMAFQIQDDLLDITADQEKFGKKIGSDLIEGKKTFLFLTALKNAKDQNDISLLNNVILNKGIKKEEVDMYKNLYEKLGVLKAAKKEIEKYTKLALRSLDTLPNNEGKELMIHLANSLINRYK
ncbi:MAG: polyprenyl synthetase family protein [Melioribacteraceae bacterium]|nr:polyprenyl synthetase family protein [Melioribacteraceae bacterium]